MDAGEAGGDDRLRDDAGHPDVASTAEPAEHRARTSRRSVLIGGAIALAAVAAAVPIGFAVWPRPGRLVEPMLAAHPFTVAHRGGSADWPEMSALAYSNAVAAGVDALEMSVSRTSDGVWFGLHDGTLDRTSGTQGFVAAQHTWAQVREHLIAPPPGITGQQPQPYLRFDALVRRYGTTHAIWIDPKAVDPSHHPELWALMARLVSRPRDVYVAKGPADSTSWAQLARSHGLQTWGFYYGSQLAADPGLFARTQAPWTLIGLDWEATAAQWSEFAADGRPVVGHVLATPAQRRTVLARGAQGLMIAGVREILG